MKRKMPQERLHFNAMTREYLAHITRMSNWALPQVPDKERKLYKDNIAIYRQCLREARADNDTEAAVWWSLQLEFTFRMLLREASDMPILRASSKVPNANAARAVVTDAQVVAALEKHMGNVTAAADELGIRRQAIYKRQSNWIKDTLEQSKGDNSSGVVTRKKRQR